MSEKVRSLEESVSVRRKDAPRESVRRRRIDQLARLLVLVVLVHEHGQDGTKDLVDHRDRLGVLRDDHGRLDVVTRRVVARTSKDDLASGSLRLGDVREALVVRLLRDDGTHEVFKLVDGTERDLFEFRHERLLEQPLALPELSRHVQTRERRAFLTCFAQRNGKSCQRSESLSHEFVKTLIPNAPWYSKAPRIAPTTEARMSADSCTS